MVKFKEHLLWLLVLMPIISCDKNDYCDDTPPVKKAHRSCAANAPVGCNRDKVMVSNFMNYTADVCMNIFTQDQIARMHFVLENSPKRKSLLNSPGLIVP